jgi:hypothetical protein
MVYAVFVKIGSAQDRVRALPAKMLEYTKARPETAGDLESPSAPSAGIGGGIQGYVVGGLTGGAAGMLGGYAGVKAGDATDSMPVALGVGTLTGAAATSALGLGLIAMQHPELVSFGTASLVAVGAAGLGVALYTALAKKKPEDTQETDPKNTTSGAIQGAFDAIPTSVKYGIAASGAMAVGLALTQVGAQVGLSGLVAPALMGGFVGAVGTLSGDRHASVRDSVYGGMLSGGIAAAISGNPAMVVAGAAAAGIGGRAVKPLGKVILGTVAGAATGALAGIMTGQTNLATCAMFGAMAGPTGALIGPPIRQVTRNATIDLTKAALSKVDPWLEKNPLNKTQKVILGASVGALSLGPIGLVAGWNGAAIAAGAGVLIGGIKTYTFLNHQQADQNPTQTNQPTNNQVQETASVASLLHGSKNVQFPITSSIKPLSVGIAHPGTFVTKSS